MVFLNKGYNKWASLVRTQNRFFSIKSTLNLDSKLSREELVLVVDEEDNPVRQATRLEVVRKFSSDLICLYRDLKTYGTEAQPYMLSTSRSNS